VVIKAKNKNKNKNKNKTGKCNQLEIIGTKEGKQDKSITPLS
jgi:hypothetical protein